MPRDRIKSRTERVMFTLSPEDIRIIRQLAEQLGETTSQIVKRAVMMLYSNCEESNKKG